MAADAKAARIAAEEEVERGRSSSSSGDRMKSDKKKRRRGDSAKSTNKQNLPDGIGKSLLLYDEIRAQAAGIAEKHRIVDRTGGLMWFFECDYNRKMAEEAAVRLRKAAMARAEAQFKVRATANAMRKATRLSSIHEQARQVCQRELYAALAETETLQAAQTEKFGQVLSKKQECSYAEGFYAVRRLNKELFELESAAAMAQAKYEAAKIFALELQEIYSEKEATATRFKHAMYQARDANQAAKDSEQTGKKRHAAAEVTRVLAELSGRVDTYGMQVRPNGIFRSPFNKS